DPAQHDVGIRGRESGGRGPESGRGGPRSSNREVVGGGAPVLIQQTTAAEVKDGADADGGNRGQVRGSPGDVCGVRPGPRRQRSVRQLSREVDAEQVEVLRTTSVAQGREGGSGDRVSGSERDPVGVLVAIHAAPDLVLDEGYGVALAYAYCFMLRA